MSQDLQLFNRGPATQIEPWATGGGSTALASPIPQANPLLKIHRSMRGRYVLAAVLALLGAAAGGAAGYMTGEPGYVSKGAIRVVPTMLNLDRADTVMQMYDRFMTSQAMILHEREAHRSSPSSTRTGRPSPPSTPPTRSPRSPPA